ncbi:MAG: hypothetical protein JSW27_07110 [Phycisphaerales bacterium]|nr:MAG: hypothetical protein JSW27_07110 [Phycisphaerales bacterium]
MEICEEHSQVQMGRQTISSCLKRHGRLQPGPCLALFLGIACLLSSQALGDTLQLRNGTALQGGFVSFDGETIKFATNLGLQSIPRAQALVLTFAAPAATASASPPPSQPAAPAPAGQTAEPAATSATASPQPSGPVTIPAGTVLVVSMTSQVSSQSKAGQRFSAKVATDVKAGPAVVARAGTTVYGRVIKSSQARRLSGRSTLELALSEINIGGTMYPLMTTNFAEAGKSSFRKTARNAGVGALIGGAVGDSDDAKTGAAIGVGVSVIRKGQSITVPVGAKLEFRMTQPLTITL